MPSNKLNIKLVAAEIGRNVDVCCEFQREYITFQEIWGSQAQPEVVNGRMSVFFVVLPSGLRSGIHTLHPKIVI